jgi:hypothetical protein
MINRNGTGTTQLPIDRLKDWPKEEEQESVRAPLSGRLKPRGEAPKEGRALALSEREGERGFFLEGGKKELFVSVCAWAI